jgi:hypothetical protein
MTALLPIALKGTKTELVRDAVTSLCLFFNAIEQKVIDEEKLLDLERRHFETLCLLEATFPPSFFDLMLHLTSHLAREIWFLGYKNEPFVFANDVEQVFYVPDLAKNWSVVMPRKKGLWGLKMLLRRRNTTSLMKFHPLTFHTSPNSWELTKHRTCEATMVKKSIYRNEGRKSKPDFY